MDTFLWQKQKNAKTMDAFGVMDLFQISRELVGAKNKSCPDKQRFYQPLLVRYFKSSRENMSTLSYISWGEQPFCCIQCWICTLDSARRRTLRGVLNEQQLSQRIASEL